METVKEIEKKKIQSNSIFHSLIHAITGMTISVTGSAKASQSMLEI
jgi:hypothetical protein